MMTMPDRACSNCKHLDDVKLCCSPTQYKCMNDKAVRYSVKKTEADTHKCNEWEQDER